MIEPPAIVDAPDIRVARTIYRGGYEGLADAWGEIRDWIGGAGYAIADDLFERYLVGPEVSDDPRDWQTELSQPLA